MIDPQSQESREVSANAAEYRRAFVWRVHQLLRMGYERLVPADYADEEEPGITGDLEQAIQAVCDDPRSPDWVMQFASSDDPPVNVPGRKGKRRPRIDLRIVSLERRPRSRFYFEAKRLGPAHGPSKYWGKDGLGCFLRGDYAREEEDGGMLGYIQSAEEPLWVASLQAGLSDPACGLIEYGAWRRYDLGPECLPAYQTKHMRREPNRPITICHTLLAFR